MRYYFANVLDTERTCYPDNVFPDGEVQEVIEFGITTVNLETLEIVGDSVSIAVVPTMSRVSQYCTDLTGWTYEALVQQGVTFDEACRRIVEEFQGHERLLVVDSDSDMVALRRQCQILNRPLPFGPSQLNVSMLFSLLTGRRRTVGNQKLLRLLGQEPEPVRHRADADSRGTARAFLEVVRRGAFTV